MVSKSLYETFGLDYQILSEGDSKCHHSFINIKRTEEFEEWTCDMPGCGKHERVCYPINPFGGRDDLLHVNSPPHAFIRFGSERTYNVRDNGGGIMMEIDRNDLSNNPFLSPDELSQMNKLEASLSS